MALLKTPHPTLFAICTPEGVLHIVHAGANKHRGLFFHICDMTDTDGGELVELREHCDIAELQMLCSRYDLSQRSRENLTRIAACYEAGVYDG